MDLEERSGHARTIGPYELLEPVGQGGMGVVYRARNAATGELAAVKIAHAVESDDLERFRREAHTLGRLQHPGVVRVLTQGVDRGTPWYAMELIDGISLAGFWSERSTAWSSQGDPPAAVSASLRLIARLCAPLAFLHGEGVVHRDLKPGNVMMRDDGTPVLVDFGLVGRFAAPFGREAIEAGGSLAGTFHYVAPEQVRGEFVDARADLYALGCILYESVTGRPPFEGEPWEVLQSHLGAVPDPPSTHAPGVPPVLDQLILRLLAKEARARIGYAADVARELSAFTAEPQPTATPAQTYLYRPAFSGRSTALGRIRDRLTSALAGEGSIILCTGESGAGKTRLAMEVTRHASSLGAAVVTGECMPVERSEAGSSGVRGGPLHPLRSLLRSIADHCSAAGSNETERLLGRRAKVLAIYEPSLSGVPGFAGHADPPPLPAEAARLRVVSDLLETVRHFAAVKPMLLVLDDLQWGDELTMAFLGSLASGPISNLPLLVVGTYRSEEGTDELQALGGEPTVESIRVDRLDRGSVEQIVSDMLALERAPDTLLRFVQHEAEGNPFYVCEYLRTLVSSGLLERSDVGRWQVVTTGSETSFASLGLPRTIRELVTRRLDDLPSEARSLVHAGSVLGREFDLRLAERISGVDADSGGMAHLLMLRQVIEDVDGRRFRFVHDKVREAAYSRISPEDARSLHARAAAEIEQAHRGSAELAQLLPSLAHHWSMAEVPDKAMDSSAAAGEHALATGAYAEARALLERALAFDAQLQRPTKPSVRARWHRKLGEACAGLGRMDEGITSSLACLTELGQKPARTTVGWLGQFARQLGTQVLHRKVRVPEQHGDERSTLREAAASTAQAATSFFFKDDYLRGIACALHSMNFAERGGSPATAATAYAQVGVFLGALKLHRLAVAYLSRVNSLRRADCDPSILGSALYFDAIYRTSIADWAESERVASEAFTLLDGAGNRKEAELAAVLAGHPEYYSGRFREAERRYRWVIESAKSHGSKQHLAWGCFLSGRSLLATGEIDAAVALLEEGWTLVHEVGDRTSTMLCGGPLIRALWSSGAHDRAREITRNLAGDIRASRPMPVAQCIDGYGAVPEILLRLFDSETDERLRRDLLDDARACIRTLRLFALLFPIAQPAMLRCRALLAWRRSKGPLASRLIDRAVAASRRCRMPYEEAQCLHEAARMMSPGPRREEAKIAAGNLYRRLGCELHLQELEELV